MRVLLLIGFVVAAPVAAQGNGGRGVDAGALDGAFARAAGMAPITSLLVAHRGVLVREAYFRGLRPGQRVNVKSASKSIIAALIGIAVAQGHVRLDHRLVDLFPRRVPAASDPRWADVTLADLLSMRSGLETSSFHNYGRWVSSPNWVDWVLQRPFECRPRTCWTYSTGSYHLLSAILTQATGRSTLAFAREQLFEPLGVRLAEWERDPQGIYLGGNNMLVSPRELLAFGLVFANSGRHDTLQLIPEEWIRTSWVRRARSPWNGHRYGYGWWIRDIDGWPVYFAWGYGGQYLLIVPDLDLVVVVTSSLNGRRLRDHNWAILRLLRDEIMPVFD